MSGTHTRGPAVAILAALALLVGLTVAEALQADGDRLPGIDAVNVYVWEVYTRSALAEGRLPHWNPYHFAGTPHLADPQTTVFYPPAMLLRWMPPLQFLGWMVALHLWLGGAGTLFLCRVLGLRWLAAAAAAVAVMLGGSVGAWVYNGHLLVIYGTVWLPWLIAFAVISIRRESVLPHPGLVIIFMLQFLAGYLQASVYIAAAVGSYYVYSLLWPEAAAEPPRRARLAAQLACLAVLAAGVSAFQLAPTLRLAAEAGRAQGLTYEDAAEGGWSLDDMASVFFPYSAIEGAPPERHGADRVVYVGWMLACVVPFAFMDQARRRIAVFFALLAAGAVALALPDALPLYAWHHAIVPGLRAPGRLLFVANLGMAMLGAIGLDRFVGLVGAGAWRRVAAGIFATAAAAAAASLVLWLHPGYPGLPPSHLWPWLCLAGVGGLFASGVLAARGAHRIALVGALALTTVDVTAYASDAMETVPIEAEEDVAAWVGAPDGGRAVTLCENRLGAGQMLMQRQATLDGMAGMHLGDYADWAYLAGTGDPPPGDGMFRRVGSEGRMAARRDLIDSANVTTIYSCAPLDLPSLRLEGYAPPVYRYANLAAWPRASWVCDVQRLPRYEVLNRLRQSRYDARGRLIRRRLVNVRWARGTSAEERRAIEARHGLADGVWREGDTWQYVLRDPSPSNGLALIQNPAVEDTAGLDRATGAVLDPPAAAPLRASDDDEQLLVGSRDCPDAGTVSIVARDDPTGYLHVRVDAPAAGVVFLSEPYYSERRVYLDGRPAPAIEANLAFTAVEVPAGRHDIELHVVPRSFQAGAGISAMTLVGWVAAARAGRRRAKRHRPLPIERRGAAPAAIGG